MKKLFIFSALAISTIYIYILVSEFLVEDKMAAPDLIFTGNEKITQQPSALDKIKVVLNISSGKNLKVVQSGYLDPELDEIYSGSDDLFALALELFNLAIDGNSTSQYYLAKILMVCEAFLGSRVNGPSELSSILEMGDWWHTRCSGFTKENIGDFGEVDKWISLSTKSQFPLAIAFKYALADSFVKNEKTQEDLQIALRSRHKDVMDILSYIAEDASVSAAWKLLACDYGYDCSGDSKEFWRIESAAHCTLLSYDGINCDLSASYLEYIKSSNTSKEFKVIMEKKNYLKEMIGSNRIDELNLEQMLN
ncbi:MAG: hypothetical protein L3J46_07045 [Kangiellaceae bacterium]|nr:hypothetical protein [Kangiellaceae bacterium]